MWLQRQIALLWTNQETWSFKGKASRSTVTEALAYAKSACATIQI